MAKICRWLAAQYPGQESQPTDWSKSLVVVTTAVAAQEIAKLGSGPTMRAAAGWFRKATLVRRVITAVTARTEVRAFDPDPSDLRRWLARHSVRSKLASGEAKNYELLLRDLCRRITGKNTEGQANAIVLLRAIVDELLRAQEPSDSIAMSTNILAGRISEEGEATRATLERLECAIVRPGAAAEALSVQVRQLHPWRAATAQELAPRWPAIGDIVTIVAGTARPVALFEGWAEEPPAALLDAPPEGWTFIAALAADYGAAEAAISFINRAISLGDGPTDYLLARSALLVNPVDAERKVRASEILAKATTHPLGAAQIELLGDRLEAALSRLDEWKPESASDRSIKTSLQIGCLAGLGRTNEAIAAGLAGVEAEPQSSGLQLRTAELLLSRGRYGTGNHPLSDYIQAAELAVRARDSRRAWRGDSVAAALIAIRSFALATDVDRALSLTKLPPEGEANEREVNDPRLTSEAAQLAAAAGQIELATALAEAANDEYTRVMVEGWAKDAADDRPGATAAWLRAFALAPDDGSQLQIAAALAQLGGQLPDLGALEQRHQEAVSTIKSIHEAMSADGDKRAILRARAPGSHELTVILAAQLSAEGEYEEAADVLAAGGRRWQQPNMMRMAGDRYLRSGLPQKALDAATSALALGGADWVGRLEAEMVRFDAFEKLGQYQDSLDVVRLMTTIAPGDTGIRWVLVQSLVRAGELDAAWSALTHLGEPLAPRDAHDARIWIGLVARNDKSSAFVQRALTMMHQWEHEPELVGLFLAEIYRSLQTRSDVHPDDLQALHDATATYAAAQPDSPSFKVVTVETADLPSAIKAALEQKSTELEDLHEQVKAGELPLGLLAHAAGRTYAEAVLRRAAGLVFSHAGPTPPESINPAGSALGQRVVLSTSAAATLALFDNTLRIQLIGAFSQLTSTDVLYRDALACQEALNLKSTLTLGWDPVSQNVAASEISDDEADMLANRSDALATILASTDRRPWQRNLHFSSLSDMAWLSAADSACVERRPLWSDDRLERALAEDAGVPAFGSIDLLRAMVALGRIAADVAEQALALLVSNYYVDLVPSHAQLRHAAELAAWAPRGAAASLGRASTWGPSSDTLAFLLEAAERTRLNPEHLRHWIGLGALGLLRAAPDQTASSGNAQFLLRMLISQSWAGPEYLGQIVEGIRYAISLCPADDPLEPVLKDLYSFLRAKHGASGAAELLLLWVQQLGPDDKSTAARVVLLSR